MDTYISISGATGVLGFPYISHFVFIKKRKNSKNMTIR